MARAGVTADPADLDARCRAYPHRHCHRIVLDPQLGATYEAVVAVDDGFVRSFRVAKCVDRST
jgi:hypothetical protein